MSDSKKKQKEPVEGELELEITEETVDNTADGTLKEEVIKDLDVPAKIVASIEKRFPRIQSFRGEDGRDYFTPENLSLLAKIVDMHYRQGFTLKGVQNFLDTQGITSSAPKSATKATSVKEDKKPKKSASKRKTDSVIIDSEKLEALDNIGHRMQAILARVEAF